MRAVLLGHAGRFGYRVGKDDSCSMTTPWLEPDMCRVNDAAMDAAIQAPRLDGSGLPSRRFPNGPFCGDA